MLPQIIPSSSRLKKKPSDCGHFFCVSQEQVIPGTRSRDYLRDTPYFDTRHFFSRSPAKNPPLNTSEQWRGTRVFAHLSAHEKKRSSGCQVVGVRCKNDVDCLGWEVFFYRNVWTDFFLALYKKTVFFLVFRIIVSNFLLSFFLHNENKRKSHFFFSNFPLLTLHIEKGLSW